MSYFKKASKEIVELFLGHSILQGRYACFFRTLHYDLTQYMQTVEREESFFETVNADMIEITERHLINNMQWIEADAQSFYERLLDEKFPNRLAGIKLINTSASINLEINMGGEEPEYLIARVKAVQALGIKVPDMFNGVLMLLEYLTQKYNELLKLHPDVDIPWVTLANAVPDEPSKALSEFLYAHRLFRLVTMLSSTEILALIKNKNYDAQ